MGNIHLIGSREAEKRLNMSRSSFQRAVQKGLIPYAVKLPGHTGAWLFDPKEIAEIAEDSNRGELNANNPDRYRRSEIGEVA